VVIEGVRHRVKGKIGHTLAQALADSSIPLVAESCERTQRAPNFLFSPPLILPNLLLSTSPPTTPPRVPSPEP
jgi:hypothetical protein